MSRRDNAGGWNKSHLSARGRPRGLRGKQIGLYYRNLQMKGNLQKKQELKVHLTIPPAVISGIQRNIEAIKVLAKQCNIELPPRKSLNIISAQKGDNSESHVYDYVGPSTSSNFEAVKEYLNTSMKSSYIKDSMETIKVNDGDIAYTIYGKTVQAALRGAGDFKYGYEDIITNTFEEKLDECLSKGVVINKEYSNTEFINNTIHETYQKMLSSSDYKHYLKFRETLPAYKKSSEILNILKNNQVVVISGETGCGKSTQIPQIILDDAIVHERGAFVHILVTQPRRVAVTALAHRIAQERSQACGVSVGYTIRLESDLARPRGSIMFCTTGILLTEIEANQALSKYSHIIIDEVHERDCHIDIAMSMLKRIIQKRKDLKVILMSATLDAEALSAYFDNCPVMHIEGLAYPVKDIYLEDILDMIKYTLPREQQRDRHQKPWQRKKMKKQEDIMRNDIEYKAEIAPWLESIKHKIDRQVYLTLQDSRIEDLNIDLIYQLIVHICKEGNGAILVFLPGFAQITALLNMLDNDELFPESRYVIYPVHSKIPTLMQRRIFDPPPPNMRKIVVATNIAETSITIDDIVYVIDCGKIKQNGFDSETHVHTLKTEWASQTNLRQRRGRAGRCQPGTCFHLMTSYRAQQIPERLLPELQRSSLLESVLTLKRLRLGKAADALRLFLSPPAETTIEKAIKHLSQTGALNSEEKLTPLGWHLARLPVHPAAGKLLLLGTAFGCLNRASSVAAVWAFKDPFQLVIGKERQADAAKRSLALSEPSDHVAISEAVMQFESISCDRKKWEFARENFLSYNTLDQLYDMKNQFGYDLRQMGFLRTSNVRLPLENRNNENISLFKALIAASLYPNVANVRWLNTNARNSNKKPRIKVRTPEDGAINIHPSSVMANQMFPGGLGPMCVNPGANWLVYWLKQQSSDLYLMEVTLVNTLPFLFFGELKLTEATDPSEVCVSISTIKVTCLKSTMELLWHMRTLLDQVMSAKIVDTYHRSSYIKYENQVIDSIIEIITAEDERAEIIGGDDDNNSESDG